MYIYLITNTVNKKKYIGQTIQPLKKRLNQHIKRAFKYIDEMNASFHSAIRKYGPSAWEISLLHTCKNVDELNNLEVYYINKYNTYKGRGYNCSAGGLGNNGYKHTDDAKYKIGSVWRNKKQPKSMQVKKSKTMKEWYADPKNAALRKEQIQSSFDSKVYQYDKDMNLVHVWPSIRECKLSGSPGARYSLRTNQYSKGYLYSKEKLH